MKSWSWRPANQGASVKCEPLRRLSVASMSGDRAFISSSTREGNQSRRFPMRGGTRDVVAKMHLLDRN